MKLLCLHGFLGKPSDFNFLKDRYDILAPDLSQYIGLDFNQLYKKMAEQIDLKHCHILGYSFGARLGARIFSNSNSSGKLICLGGHLGLENSDQITERQVFESGIVEKLSELTEIEFLKIWNNYGIFKFDKPVNDVNFENASLYFKNYGLSLQPNLNEILLEKKDSIHFFFGNEDEKYIEYAKNKLSKFNVHIMDGVGHRILQHPDIVNDILSENLCKLK